MRSGNPDVALVDMDLRGHYQRFERLEGRKPISEERRL